MNEIALSPLRLEVVTALRNDMLPVRRPNLPSVFYDLPYSPSGRASKTSIREPHIAVCDDDTARRTKVIGGEWLLFGEGPYHAGGNPRKYCVLTLRAILAKLLISHACNPWAQGSEVQTLSPRPMISPKVCSVRTGSKPVK